MLDDMERMAQPGIASYCDFCTGSPVSRHFEGCPLLAIPKIVAVLEAVERVMTPRQYDERDEFVGVPADQVRVVDAVAYDALRAAMQGGKGQA